jgi:hypothetical protein
MFCGKINGLNLVFLIREYSILARSSCILSCQNTHRNLEKEQADENHEGPEVSLHHSSTPDRRPRRLLHNDLDRTGIPTPVVKGKERYFLLWFQQTYQGNEALHTLHGLLVDG